MGIPDLSAVTPTVPTTLEEILDLEAIKVLKVRYWQTLDAHMWSEFETLLTDEVTIEMDRAAFESLQAFMELNQSGMVGQRTMHQAWGLPAIELYGDGMARGFWYMTATVRGDRFNHVERGVYEDEYRKRDGVWLIDRINLTHSIVIEEDGSVPYQEGHWWEED